MVKDPFAENLIGVGVGGCLCVSESFLLLGFVHSPGAHFAPQFQPTLEASAQEAAITPQSVPKFVLCREFVLSAPFKHSLSTPMHMSCVDLIASIHAVYIRITHKVNTHGDGTYAFLVRMRWRIDINGSSVHTDLVAVA